MELRFCIFTESASFVVYFGSRFPFRTTVTNNATTVLFPIAWSWSRRGRSPPKGPYVNMRFGPPIRSNALGELKDLRRTGSVEDYQRQFLALLCRCDNLTWQHQVDLFTSGLGQPLCSDVEMQRPASLQTAMSFARAFEKRAADAAGAVSSTTPRPGTRQRPPAPSQPATAPPAEKQDEQRPRFRRLSPEEITEKCANGQCYFCPKKFTKEHRCARKDVFLMELEDGEELFDDTTRALSASPSMH